MVTLRSKNKLKFAYLKAYSNQFLKLSLIAVAFFGTTSVACAADTLKYILSDLVVFGPRIEAAKSDRDSAATHVDEVFTRAWTPQLDLNSEVGKQRYQLADNSSTDKTASRTTLRLTQQLYDFGRSSRQVAGAEALAAQSAAVTESTREGLLLDALNAHWGVVRAQRVLEYSRQSEASIRNQANLENSLVELGKGYESNVLQAKVQLAGAEARRMQMSGGWGFMF